MAARRSIEITAMSATDMNRDVYAEVAIAGQPRTKQRTPVSDDSSTSADWRNLRLRFTVDGDSDVLHIVLRSKRLLGDRFICEVHIPIRELLQTVSAVDECTSGCYQLRTRSGSSHGTLFLTYKPRTAPDEGGTSSPPPPRPGAASAYGYGYGAPPTSAAAGAAYYPSMAHPAGGPRAAYRPRAAYPPQPPHTPGAGYGYPPRGYGYPPAAGLTAGLAGVWAVGQMASEVGDTAPAYDDAGYYGDGSGMASEVGNTAPANDDGGYYGDGFGTDWFSG